MKRWKEEGGKGYIFRVVMFFFPRYMKRWKEEGGKGYIFRVVMFFFIVERLGRGRGNLGFQNHIYLPFFFFFFSY
jgi:hypothetical protein